MFDVNVLSVEDQEKFHKIVSEFGVEIFDLLASNGVEIVDEHKVSHTIEKPNNAGSGSIGVSFSFQSQI